MQCLRGHWMGGRWNARTVLGAAIAVALLAACTPEETGGQAEAVETSVSSNEAAAAGASGDMTPPASTDDQRTRSRKPAKKTTSRGTAGQAGKAESSRSSSPSQSRTRYRVIRVVDGDTVKVDINGGESVRVIGIDAPESVHPNQPVECGGVEASAKARAMLSGKRVSLDFDSTQGRRDKYDRLLAYVGVPGVGDFGEAMLRAGHAEEYTYAAPYRRQATYRRAEQQARSAGRGMWGSCSQAQRPTSAPTSTPTSAVPTSVAPQPTPTYTPPPAPKPAAPKPPVNSAPGPGWTNDALTPGYTGCRQGYPGGRINGVYWWKPITC